MEYRKTQNSKREKQEKRPQMVKALFHVIALNAENHKVRQTQITFKGKLSLV